MNTVKYFDQSNHNLAISEGLWNLKVEDSNSILEKDSSAHIWHLNPRSLELVRQRDIYFEISPNKTWL